MVHAGHETTASALSSALWLLGRHLDVQEMIRAEVAAEVGDEPPTAEALGRCETLDRFIREAMRLYPPAWMTAARVAIEDDEIDGFEVRAGQQVGVAIRELHRNPDCWRDPERFDPDRFEPGRSADRHKMSWIPFGGGRRRCIGEHLAMLELRAVLARAISRFTISTPGSDAEPPLDVTFTLGPRRVELVLAA